MDDVQIEPSEVSDDLASASAPEHEEAEQLESTEAEEGQEQEGSSDDQETEERLFNDEQQAKIDDIVSGKVAKTHEVKRELEATQRELEAIKAKLPQEQAPEVPDLPNPDDFYGDPDGYNKAMANRDAAIVNRAGYDARQASVVEAEQRQEQQQEQARIEKQTEVATGYVERAKTFGIAEDKLQQQADMVGQLIPSSDIQDFVATDEHGPLIVDYLTRNLDEAEKIGQMDTASAAIYIHSNIKPNLASTRRKPNAPAPADIVDGGGSPKSKDPNLDGVIFE